MQEVIGPMIVRRTVHPQQRTPCFERRFEIRVMEIEASFTDPRQQGYGQRMPFVLLRSRAECFNRDRSN
jgi:hypothetical protein